MSPRTISTIGVLAQVIELLSAMVVSLMKGDEHNGKADSMSVDGDENVPIQEGDQPEPFFIIEYVEAELIAVVYEFEPPSHVCTAGTACLSQATGSSTQ